jgi:K+-sensing histidine kinase KdpD
VAPAGGRVAVRVTRDGATAMVAVSAPGASGAPVTGMRLAIVRRLLELHGGTAATARADDRGPTLTVKLPVN